MITTTLPRCTHINMNILYNIIIIIIAIVGCNIKKKNYAHFTRRFTIIIIITFGTSPDLSCIFLRCRRIAIARASRHNNNKRLSGRP